MYNSRQYGLYRETFRHYVAPWGLSGDQINGLHRFIPGAVLSKMNGDFSPTSYSNDNMAPVEDDNGEFVYELDDNGKVVRDEAGFPIPKFKQLQNAEYYLKYLPDEYLSRLEENPELKENDFLKALHIVPAGGQYNNTKSNKILSFRYPVFNLDMTEKNGFTNAWDELMSMGGDFSTLAKDIYLHFYYAYGLNPLANRVMEIAPVSVLESLVAEYGGDASTNISYLDIYRKDDLAFDEEEIKQDVIKYMLLNSSDETIVKKMPWHRDDSTKTSSSSVIRVSGSKLEDVKLGKADLKHFYASPIINVDGVTYVLSSVSIDGFRINENINNVFTNETRNLLYTQLRMEIDDAFKSLSKGGFCTSQNAFLFGDYSRSISIFSDSGQGDQDNSISEQLHGDESENDDIDDAVEKGKNSEEKRDADNQLSC